MLRSLILGIAFVTASVTSCASAQLFPTLALDFFVPAARQDPWSEKIASWQQRHLADPIARGDVAAGASKLGRDWQDFERELRRKIAADTVSWVQ